MLILPLTSISEPYTVNAKVRRPEKPGFLYGFSARRGLARWCQTGALGRVIDLETPILGKLGFGNPFFGSRYPPVRLAP